MRLAHKVNEEWDKNPSVDVAAKYGFSFRSTVYADHPEALSFKTGPGPIPEIEIDPVHVVRVGQDGTDIECLLKVALAMGKYPMVLLITGKGLGENS